MKKRRLRRILLVVLILVTTAFIWCQSLKNGEESQETSSVIQQLFIKLCGQWIQDTFFFEHIRKVAHFTEFALLGVEWCGLFLLQGKGERRRWWLPVAGPLTAVCDEMLQFTSPGRAPAAADVLLDSGGYFCGILAVGIVFFLWRRRQAHRQCRKP